MDVMNLRVLREEVMDCYGMLSTEEIMGNIPLIKQIEKIEKLFQLFEQNLARGEE